MNAFTWRLSLAIWLLLIPAYQTATPLFLQAITSALATIPFSGGPMTTGLAGAKLAIGTKLLYYLGFFGRRSKPKPVPAIKKAPAVKIPAGGGFSAVQKIPAGGGFSTVPKIPSGGLPAGGLQAVPLPYFFSGIQQGAGFGVNQPYGGLDPAQVFQALRAQGFDPNTAMQLMNYGDGGFANVPQGGGFANVPQGGGFANVPQDLSENPQSRPDEMQMIQTVNDEPENIEESQNPGSDDIESFFTFLKDMDENTCISRLVCDIGRDPSFLGDFSENIHNIIGSLDVQPTSGAYPYMEIMDIGRREGGCSGRFPECSDGAYEVVKNVAPSVGVPQNIDPQAVNQL